MNTPAAGLREGAPDPSLNDCRLASTCTLVITQSDPLLKKARAPLPRKRNCGDSLCSRPMSRLNTSVPPAPDANAPTMK